MNRDTLAWNMYEFHFVKKNADWYWALGIISLAGAVAAVYFNNILFAIIILLGAFALGMHGNVEPNIKSYSLSRRGAAIEDTLYPFDTLDSFWIEESEKRPNKILLKSRKMLMPFIVMPISPDVDPDEIRHFFLDHGLPEVEHQESLLHQIFEYLGF